LRLNDGVAAIKAWDVNAIMARAKAMAEQASHVWPSAQMSEDILANYQPQIEGGVAYAIEDHPHLAKVHVNALFEVFRYATLALDACVSEVFLKLYIAYKAEVNFVDIIPQAQSLKLSLNIPFTEINDPRNICRDVTNIGCWGNGDVEVMFERVEDLPHIMFLVRQAFERQMGN